MNELLNPDAFIPVSDESFDNIIAFMQTFLFLSGAFRVALRSCLLETIYKKDSIILNAGVKQPYLWFIVDGLVREISLDRYTRETQTSWFWYSSNFVYAMPGFFDQTLSQISIKAVRDTRAILISYEHCRNLRSRFNEADLLFELIRSKHAMARKNHLKEILNTDTVSRYLKYEKELELLFQNIKLKHIAQYMGMSIDTLGKLRRKLIRKKSV